MNPVDVSAQPRPGVRLPSRSYREPFRRIEDVPSKPGAASSNPVIAHLRHEVRRLRELTGAYVGADGELLGRRPRLGTKVSWALLWREWAIEDLGPTVAERKRAYVICRDQVVRYLLFLDGKGRHLLAVRPDAPCGRFRYQKLSHNKHLAELHGPDARVVFELPD
jgi:hypothetical protein